MEEIITGWANVIKDKFDLLDESTKEIAQYRMAHCTTCTMRIDNTCSKARQGANVKTLETVSGCGCNLSAKTLSPNSQCPLSKW